MCQNSKLTHVFRQTRKPSHLMLHVLEEREGGPRWVNGSNMSMYRHFYASAALEIHTTISTGQPYEYHTLQPVHFYILRAQFQVIRWDAIYNGMMDPRIHTGEVAFFDSTFMTGPDPVKAIEENSLFRSELLYYLRQVQLLTYNGDNDENRPPV